MLKNEHKNTLFLVWAVKSIKWLNQDDYANLYYLRWVQETFLSTIVKWFWQPLVLADWVKLQQEGWLKLLPLIVFLMIVWFREVLPYLFLNPWEIVEFITVLLNNGFDEFSFVWNLL